MAESKEAWLKLLLGIASFVAVVFGLIVVLTVFRLRVSL